MKIVMAGTSGFIGKPLEASLAKDHEVVRLTRRPAPGAAVRQVAWDPSSQGEWVKEIDGADAVINLSGESIAGGRWTNDRKKALITSRLNSTRAIVDAIARASARPKVLLNASGIGGYGPRDASPVDESAPYGSDFLADLCREWERQAQKAESFGVRVVLLRTGLVLGHGGALEKMLLPFRLGLGGPLGDGKQVYSWIHIDDEVGAIRFALENSQVRGPVNLTAPQPAVMKDFAKTLGRVLGRPAFLPAPAFALRMLLGEMAGMLLTGQNARPAALEKAGYRFRYPELEGALRAILTRK